MVVFNGLLKIKICEAVSLKPTAWSLRHAVGPRPQTFLLDPYIALNVDDSRIGQTATKQKTNSPAWHDEFVTDVCNGRKIELAVFHDAPIGYDDFVANCTIQFEELLQNGSRHFEDWVSPAPPGPGPGPGPGKWPWGSGERLTVRRLGNGDGSSRLGCVLVCMYVLPVCLERNVSLAGAAGAHKLVEPRPLVLKAGRDQERGGLAVSDCIDLEPEGRVYVIIDLSGSSGEEPMVPVDPSSMASDPAHTAIPHNLSTHEALEQVDEENEAGNTRESGKASSGLGLEDFDLLRVIGRGSYGKVLLVQLKESNRIYAVKAVKKEQVNVDQIQREKLILQQASICPFLVALDACFQTESRLFLVLDCVSWGDLLFHVQQQRMLPEEHARFFSAEISLAVNYLHQQGILYRNLNLENVLLAHEGLQPGDTTHTFCGTFCGTPNFMAPELIRGEDYSFSVDWWNLGVLLYMMMIRESPFHLNESSDNPYENSIKGFADVQENPFFQNVDWDMMEQKQVEPLFKPNISESFSLDNFDPEFTNEPVQLTTDGSDIVRELDGYEFAGFEYINHLTMYEEEEV
ncbi:Protein kinase C iota type [Heterocephalus glaber]|uniref:protein kinase C n=2 Tax=Boreoeutheria TaxID=1437010 RepID=G5C9T8_HETGA|nr:Protein kinase C iota type [Heterocephalus glaber]